MTPEALRRRMAHGNIYPPEQGRRRARATTSASGNLAALRELALLWVADRVDEALHALPRPSTASTEPWETRERVVVALTGGPEGETLRPSRRRIAGRAAGGELLAVHVVRGDGLAGRLTRCPCPPTRLVEELGGTFHTVVGGETSPRRSSTSPAASTPPSSSSA